MLEAFVILLREGVEAALILAILFVALRKSGRAHLEPAVHWGLGAALVASVVAGAALARVTFNEEAYEGVLLLVAAAFVGSMMLWMHREGRRLRGKIEARVEASAARGARGAWALGAFAFLMIFREGAETVLFLSAVRWSTEGLRIWIGAASGLAVAIAFGVLFVRGSLPVDLKRFFSVTEIVLGIFLAQLAFNGYHELAEAGWLPATRETMKFIGPLVRHNALFTLAIVGLPLFIWLSRPVPAGPPEPAAELSPAQRRLVLARAQRERFYRRAALACALGVLAVFGFVYARESSPRERPPAAPVPVEGDEALVSLEQLADGRLHHFLAEVGGTTVRFLAVRPAAGSARAALDACRICGPAGYIEEGPHVLCLNCMALLLPGSIGLEGGCTPIPLPSRSDGQFVRVRLPSRAPASPQAHAHGSHLREAPANATGRSASMPREQEAATP